LKLDSQPRRTPAVTVAIPTRGNDLSLLARCLSSLGSQSFRDFEIIIVCPRPDEIAVLCRSHGATALAENDGSPAAKRNMAVENAAGSLISFLDDDCEVPMTWLERVVTVFQQHPCVSCLGGPDLTPSDDGISAWAVAVGAFDTSRMTGLALDRAAVNKIKTANATYRREVFKAATFNPRTLYGDELELNMRLVQEGYHLRFDPDVFVWHRQTRGRVGLFNGLAYLFRCSIASAPILASWRTFTFARDESFLAWFYFSVLMLPLMVGLLWASPFAFCCVVAVSLLAYTMFTVLRANVTRVDVICAIPFFAVLTTLTRAVGFYIGLIRYVIDRARSNI